MATTPVLNPSPKTRFQESGDSVSKHRDLVDSTTFQRASDFAMLEYANTLAEQATDANASIHVALRLRGAREFLGVLRNLSEKPTAPPATPAIRTLNHNA